MNQPDDDIATALRSLDPLDPPAHEWDRIARQLGTEGLVGSRRPRWTLLIQSAAALIFALGAAAGALVTRVTQSRTTRVTQAPAVHSSDISRGDSTQVVRRLAAVEGILLTTQEAMKDLPGDTMLAAYRATALRERATLLSRVVLVSDQKWY